MLSKFIASRFARSARAAVALRFLPVLVALILVPLATARGGVTWQTISFLTASTFTPGNTLPCTVQLNGGPETITIYSNPPGAVSYHGVIPASATVQATTSSSAVPGSVTVYIITDGETVHSYQSRALRTPPND